MKHIQNMNEIAKVYRDGEYSASDFTLLTIADVLHSKRMMWDALRGPAMLTIDAADAAVEDAAGEVGDPAKAFMSHAYRTEIRKQALHWLIAHGTTLTALKRDYNNATYTNRYALGLRTLTYYKVPEILADLIARTGNYDVRELMEP